MKIDVNAALETRLLQMNLLHTTVLGLLSLLGSLVRSFSQSDDLLNSIGDRLESW